jgi:hypothetical protein
VARVAVFILHPEPGAGAGPLTRALGEARRSLAERHRRGFLAAGADEARVVAGPVDDTPYGRRSRSLAADLDRDAGLILLGSGAMPLATRRDRRRFVAVAASGEDLAIANNRFSADAVAIGRAGLLADLPDIEADNALPRWLEEVAGVPVKDLRDRWRLGVDLDSPIDVAIVGRDAAAPAGLRALARTTPGLLTERLDDLAARLGDRRAEVLVAGRTSTATIRWLERAAAARIRALVEERGLRASSRLALAEDLSAAASTAADRPQRPPASVLGMLLDLEGPGALGAILSRLADCAVVDTRVLLAHRLGANERSWPSAEDRFASDLLLADRIADPWLRALTRAAADSAIPVMLGGHTLVGPGLRILAQHP